MSDSSSSDSVSMEFAGPVPGRLGDTRDYHVVFWVQAAGGASFTRPSAEERAYYKEQGKSVPEWQCEYFEFENVTWSEAPLGVELWFGKTKLRSLFLEKREGRRENDLRSELPELGHFLQKHGLDFAALTRSFQESVLSAAETAGAIQRGEAEMENAASKSSKRDHFGESSWLRRTWRRVWPMRRAA